MKRANRILVVCIAVYLAWMAATYLLEGRIGQMIHHNFAERAFYVISANMLIGTLIPAVFLRQAILSGGITKDMLGSGSSRKRLMTTATALFVGLAIFVLRNPSADAIFALSAFSHVLPVSIAEVMVCWALIGAGFELHFIYRGKLASCLAGAVAADLFFALYHFTHSPPFNKIQVVLFLLIPGLLTGLVFFLGLDLYATILIQNFLGMAGVARAADVEYFSQPLYSTYILALAAMLVFVAMHLFVTRNGRSIHDKLA